MTGRILGVILLGKFEHLHAGPYFKYISLDLENKRVKSSIFQTLRNIIVSLHFKNSIFVREEWLKG